MPRPAAPIADPLHLDEQLCFAVYSTAHAFNRVYKPLLDRLGLTYPQYLVMLVLWQTDGQSVKAIGERLRLDSGTLTPLLKRLETARLVLRQRDANDERRVYIHLTEAGRRLRGTAGPIPETIEAASGCTAATLGMLKQNLIDLRDNLTAKANV